MEKNNCKCGFSCLHTYEGKKDFDEDYISIEVKQVVKKTGEGEEDFIIENKEIISRTPIKEVIESQRDSAGMEAYLKLMAARGESLQGVSVSENIDDYTNMPDDLASVVALGEKMRSLYSSLPEDLKGELTLEDFLANMNQKKLDEYISSKLPKVEKKEGE